jgi:RNA polymerase sigma factor (sigma-70 family)
MLYIICSLSTAQLGLNVLLKRMTRGLASETLNELSDEELLEQFIGQGKDAAFEAIVRRHGSMVYRVCWRVLRQTQDAEDAFQATFLLLAKNAGSIRKRAALASWLHGVAGRSAIKTQTQSAARRRHEKSLPAISSVSTNETTWTELRSLLDEELKALPDRHRLPLILCYLEGRTQDEAASQLDWSNTTFRRRLDEARKALGRRLARRGVILSAALCGPLFSDCVAWATVGPRLIVSTIDAAVHVAAGRAADGVVSAKVAAITEGVLKTMFQAKLKKFAFVLGLLVVAIAGGLGASVQWLSAQNPADKKQEAPKETWKASGILEHKHPVLCIAFGPDQFLVASDEGTPSEGGFIRVWDAGTKEELKWPKWDQKEVLDDFYVIGITYAADNSLVSFRQKKGISLHGGDDIEGGRVTGGGAGHGCNRTLATASDCKTHALVGNDPKTVQIYKHDRDFAKHRMSGEDGAVCKGHEDEPLCGAFSPDGSLLVTGSADKTARIWDPFLGNERHVLQGHTDAILVVAFSPDGKLVATGGKDGLVKFWDASNGKERASLKGHTVVRCLAFAPNGKTLVSGGEDETVRMWDVAAGREQAVLRDHKGAVVTVAFSRDGNLLASAGADKTIRLWKKQ